MRLAILLTTFCAEALADSPAVSPAHLPPDFPTKSIEIPSTELSENRSPLIAVNLTLATAETPHGTAPRFIVAIRPVAPSVAVFNFAERGDLRRHHLSVTVKKDGNTVVDIPTPISDPAPSTEADLRELKSGEELVFEYDGTPPLLRTLPQGIYRATVTVWPNLESKPVHSNAITLHIRKLSQCYRTRTRILAAGRRVGPGISTGAPSQNCTGRSPVIHLLHRRCTHRRQEARPALPVAALGSPRPERKPQERKL